MTEFISRTGRVQDWLDDPEGRLPVSCTCICPEDSMTGEHGLENSWIYTSHALRMAAGVAIHLSKLRPKGWDNGHGLIASGPVSFGKLYSHLNETLRRGGKYRSGAITLHLDADHPDLMDFVLAERHELPWAKRCVNLSKEWWDALDSEKRQTLLYGIKKGDIWLMKPRYQNGERIYGNVCLEVLLPEWGGTCLLQHVNLSACTFEDIPTAFTTGMQQLCNLHAITGVGDSGHYLPPETDRQVGLGVLGLANLLTRYGITYEQFGRALTQFNNGEDYKTAAFALVQQINKGIEAAAVIARKNKMDRAFAIAPTASCSYRSKTIDGFTATPEIAPPIARHVDRDSETLGVTTYDYGPVEIASEVGWDNYQAVADGIVRLYQKTGLFHSYSYNTWGDMVTYDENFIKDWLESPQSSMYYSLQVMPNTQDKSDVYATLDQEDIQQYLNGLLKTENQPTCDCAE